MKLRALAVVIAVVVVGGCAAAPVPGTGHPHLASGGPLGYWTRSRLLGALALAWACVPPAAVAGSSANARPAALALRIGALFVREANSSHFCTASVVASPGRDLLITAATASTAGKAGATGRTSYLSLITATARRPLASGQSSGCWSRHSG